MKCPYCGNEMGSAVTAFLCRDCKKVIIDYLDEKADFNQR